MKVNGILLTTSVPCKMIHLEKPKRIRVKNKTYIVFGLLVKKKLKEVGA